MRSRVGRRILAGYLAVSLLLAVLLAASAGAGVWIAGTTERVDRASRDAAQILTTLALAERRLFWILHRALEPASEPEADEQVLEPVLTSQLARLPSLVALQDRKEWEARLRATLAAYREATGGFLAAPPPQRSRRLSELLVRHEALRRLLQEQLAQIQGSVVAGASQLEAVQRAGWLPGFLRNLARNSERARYLSQATLATLTFESRFWRKLSASLAAAVDPTGGPPAASFQEEVGLLLQAERLAALPEVHALATALRDRTHLLEARLTGLPDLQTVRGIREGVTHVVQNLEAVRPLVEVERDRALEEVRLVNESVVSFVQTLSAAAVAALLAGFLLLVAVTGAVTSSLDALRAAMEQVRAGRLDVRVDVGRRRDETAEMARVFNHMVAELQDTRQKLQAYQADLQRLVHERTRALEETQAQLLQAERLSAVGELVAGVAHELNNPMTSVLGYAQLLESDPALPEELRGYAELVVREADRARHIVQSLLTFARPQPVEREVLDLNGVVRRTLDACRRDVDRIEVDVRMCSEPLWVLGNGVQLQQVFTNIVQNALQAIRQGPGRLVVTTTRMGERAVVEFADTGPGIPPEHLHRVFDPFFTTKKIGEGTGLGLSISYGIVRDHGGSIHVRNRSEGGACFTVELPLTEPGGP